MRRIVLIWMVWAVASGASARGATYTVPGTYSSLQAAINGAPDGSTIDVAPGVYTENLQIRNVSRNLYLRSTTPGGAVLDGGGTRQLAWFDNSGVTQERRVVFDGFVFRNGRATGPVSPLTIIESKPVFLNCVFSNNTATEKGGAILVTGGRSAATFVNNLFAANRSDQGAGAVLVNGLHPQAVFRDCVFRDNHNRTPAAGAYNEGGALLFAEGGGRVIGCRFENNSTAYAGGAIMALGFWETTEDYLLIDGCLFQDNFCSQPPQSGLPPSEGGAVMVENNMRMDILGSRFFGNRAMAGGAVHSYRAHLNITNCLFEGNTATGTNRLGYAGAIGMNNHDGADPVDRREAVLRIAGTAIRRNTGPVGGGLAVQGDTVAGHGHVAEAFLDNVVFEGNRATTAGSSYGNGGGLTLGLARLRGTNVYLFGNRADALGGAGVVVSGSDLRLHRSWMAGHSAAVDPLWHDPDSSTWGATASVIAFNPASPSVNTSAIVAIPPLTFDRRALVGYYAAPATGASIAPRIGALADQGGYAASTAADTAAAGRTNVYTLSAFQQPDRTASVFLSRGGRTNGPFSGFAEAPCRIQAENFDTGGAGAAYGDSTAANLGGAHRPGEGVDLYAYGGGGVLVGGTEPGEWIDYTFYAPYPGVYRAELRAGAAAAGGRLQAALDGLPLGGPVAVPPLAAGAFTNLSVSTHALEEGLHTLRLVTVNGGYTLDWLDIAVPAPTLAVSPGEVDRPVKQGRVAPPAALSVRNAGASNLTYTIESSAPWLVVSPTNGESAGESDAVSLQFDSAALPVGFYTAVVTISSPEAVNSPLLVPVRLRVAPDRFVENDFDGDGQSDLGCYHPPAGGWFVFKSTEGFGVNTFGFTGTRPVTGDFDGDGRADIGCYHPPSGDWFLFRTTAGFTNRQFGFAGTLPVTGDFDGDGITDIGCYHPPSGGWYLFGSSNGFWTTTFGFTGTLPVTGDFDGDGRADIGCYHPPSGGWYLFGSSSGFWTTTFGFAGTLPVTGDFDGDGRADIGCYHPAGGGWYLFRSRDGFWTTTFGYAGTIPIVGDYDADGVADIGCYDPPAGGWFVFRSALGFQTQQFGFAGTLPLGGANF